MPQADIKFPKPVGYRKELVTPTGQFIRYSVSDKPPGVPLYTEGQVRAIVQCELERMRANDNP